MPEEEVTAAESIMVVQGNEVEIDNSANDLQIQFVNESDLAETAEEYVIEYVTE